MDHRDQFIKAVDQVYGLYLDTISGFRCWKNKFDAIQTQEAQTTNFTVDELDKASFIYGKGDPRGNDSTRLHIRTQGEFKERIKENGPNYFEIAAACLVMINQYWDYYRVEIARQYKVSKNNIQWDIMADINRLRRSIIHHRGIALDDIEHCKIIGDFKPGEKIFINLGQMENIVDNIKKSTFKIIVDGSSWRCKMAMSFKRWFVSFKRWLL